MTVHYDKLKQLVFIWKLISSEIHFKTLIFIAGFQAFAYLYVCEKSYKFLTNAEDSYNYYCCYYHPDCKGSLEDAYQACGLQQNIHLFNFYFIFKALRYTSIQFKVFVSKQARTTTQTTSAGSKHQNLVNLDVSDNAFCLCYLLYVINQKYIIRRMGISRRAQRIWFHGHPQVPKGTYRIEWNGLVHFNGRYLVYDVAGHTRM